MSAQPQPVPRLRALALSVNAERERLVADIGEIVEAMPLSTRAIRQTRDRLEKTSLSVLREIWANRDEWHDAIVRGLL